MTPYASAAQSYAAVGTQSRVSETDPHGLILLLFDGAIERIELARAAIGRRDSAAKASAISKAMRIVEGLRQSLNLDAGGDVARRLDELYELISRQLLLANVRNDVTALTDALVILSHLRAGWAGIAARG